MFTQGVMMIRMSHKTHLFCSFFFADDSKKLATFWAKHLSATEKFYLVLSENGIVTVRLTVLEILRVEMSKNCWVSK